MKNEIKWYLDQDNSNISFNVRHLLLSHVIGKFKIFDASITTIGTDFTSAQIDLWIDTNSIESGNEKRDAFLKSSDFFDTNAHKQISFVSNTITKANDIGVHEMWGDLTMKGVSKNIKLDLIFDKHTKNLFGTEKANFKISGKIDRSDWGLVWNDLIEFGGIVVSDEIEIECEIQVTIASIKDEEMEMKSNTTTRI